MDAIDASPGSEASGSKTPTDKSTKLALCLWISICAVGFIWFISKVMNGRRQIRYNFQSIEEQLKRIQNSIDQCEQLEEPVEEVKDVAEKKDD